MVIISKFNFIYILFTKIKIVYIKMIMKLRNYLSEQFTNIHLLKKMILFSNKFSIILPHLMQIEEKFSHKIHQMILLIAHS